MLQAFISYEHLLPTFSIILLLLHTVKCLFNPDYIFDNRHDERNHLDRIQDMIGDFIPILHSFHTTINCENQEILPRRHLTNFVSGKALSVYVRLSQYY